MSVSTFLITPRFQIYNKEQRVFLCVPSAYSPRMHRAGAHRLFRVSLHSCLWYQTYWYSESLYSLEKVYDTYIHIYHTRARASMVHIVLRGSLPFFQIKWLILPLFRMNQALQVLLPHVLVGRFFPNLDSRAHPILLYRDGASNKIFPLSDTKEGVATSWACQRWSQ